MSAALAAAPDSEELQQLACSLTELISLTQQHSSCQQTTSAAVRSQTSSVLDNANDAPESATNFDDEMALFKVRLSQGMHSFLFHMDGRGDNIMVSFFISQ